MKVAASFKIVRRIHPNLSSRPEQIIAMAMICGVEGPAVWFSANSL